VAVNPCYFAGSGSDAPGGIACIPAGASPCGLAAGAPPVPVVSGPVGPCGEDWFCVFPGAMRLGIAFAPSALFVGAVAGPVGVRVPLNASIPSPSTTRTASASGIQGALLRAARLFILAPNGFRSGAPKQLPESNSPLAETECSRQTPPIGGYLTNLRKP
jgi:hypothetical protein